MSVNEDLLLAGFGLFCALFCAFCLWWLHGEYQRDGKLSAIGAILHVAMYAAHGMLTGFLAWGWRWDAPPPGPLAWPGYILMALGLLGTFAGMDFFRQFGRWVGSDLPGLRTEGLYRYSRNPQFVAYGLLLIGFAVAWPQPRVLIGLAAYVLLVFLVARIEEEHLEQVYGQEYRDYCARVPRFVGWPRRV